MCPGCSLDPSTLTGPDLQQSGWLKWHDSLCCSSAADATTPGRRGFTHQEKPRVTLQSLLLLGREEVEVGEDRRFHPGTWQ